MKNEILYDISDVCKMLNTTSRTLRFYEEKNIISSTNIGISARRQYSESQIEHIKNVLVLRTLGLSIKNIAELQSQKTDLRESILSKRAEIYAYIDSKTKEINLLNDALCNLDAGNNIFTEQIREEYFHNTEILQIATICTNAIIENNTDLLYKYLNPNLINYMPKDIYSIVRADTISQLGEFISIDRIVTDQKYSNRLYSKVTYSKLGLKITFVFNNDKISGLWLGYYETER